MTYRFRLSPRAGQEKRTFQSLRLKGARTLRHIPFKEFYRLEDPEPYLTVRKMPKASRLGRLLERLRARLGRTSPYRTLPLFAGAFCGLFTVTVLTLGLSTAFLFAPFWRSYVSVTVPDLCGCDPSEIDLQGMPIDLILHYEENPTVPAGLVISQSPRGGVARRLYSQRERLTLTLTVSRAPETFVLEDLKGLLQRDAVLTLKNRSLSVKVEKITSTRPAGTVLSTDPPAGTSLSSGRSVTLVVSKGQPVRRAYVPDLVGLGESEAVARLRYAGLPVGSIRYVSAEASAGTVLSQSYPAYSMVEADTPVDLTVSLGDRYTLKTVPDLYGMTTEQARALLALYGLTVGSIYRVGNAAPAGTVISQSPPPDTPLSSATVAVDLFISQ